MFATYSRLQLFPLLGLALAYGCSGEDAGAESSFNAVPVGLEFVGAVTGPITDPDSNPLTPEKAELGKYLFFDTRLSSNDMVSCETCHLHSNGWTDGKQFSQKVNGAMNSRNSPTLYNTGYHPQMYWDGRSPSLENNIGAAWGGHMTADGDKEAIVAKINAVDGYGDMFQAAFGAEATADNIPMALASFVRTLYSGNSAYDQYQAGDTGAMSADAIAGMAIFNDVEKGGCAQCHVAPLFTDLKFHNIGLGFNADTGEFADMGRNDRDDPPLPGAFKTPTLRSVAKSAPYFHDGSVATLEEAVRYMVEGGTDNPHRDTLLQPKELTDEEIGQLVAFLQALNSNESFTKPTPLN